MANQGHSLHTLSFRSLKRSHDLFESVHGAIPELETSENELLGKIKTLDQYGVLSSKGMNCTVPSTEISIINREISLNKPRTLSFPEPNLSKMALTTNPSNIEYGNTNNDYSNTQLVMPKKARTVPKPDWHAPWKLCRVVSGHTGWVRCVSFSPDNDFFMTGSDDRMLKIWDFATGKLRLSLTGHVSSVRGVKISPRHPYVFSCGEDKTVKCWDLEQNKVIRHYHGHTSAVYTLDIHPELDVLVTGGRDSVVRVWDMRTKINVHVLTGHRDAVASVKCQETLPEIVSGAHDATVRLWDLRAAKTQSVLTNHKKAVRSVFIHPVTDHFMSGSADGIKQFNLPEGQFVQNMRGHNTIINAVTVNSNNIAVSGGNDGTLYFWDWKSGYNFQKLQSPPQPGSLDSENSILGLSFDVINQRLVTVEGDKTIKFYKEDLEATEESHPILWRPNVSSYVYCSLHTL